MPPTIEAVRPTTRANIPFSCHASGYEFDIQRRMEQAEASVARYLAALETADRHDPGGPTAKVQRLQEKLERLREQMRHPQCHLVVASQLAYPYAAPKTKNGGEQWPTPGRTTVSSTKQVA